MPSIAYNMLHGEDAEAEEETSAASAATTASTQDLTNWNRQYRVMLGPSGGGVEIGEATLEQPVPLHCSFSIDKSDTTTCNTANLSLWNLNPEHLAALKEKDCAVVVRAGYGNRLNLVFAGIVSHATTSQDGSDMKTEIELLDNLTQIRDTYVSLSYTGKVNWKTILDDVGSQMGVAVAYGYNAEFADVENGYSYVGKATAVLDKACSCCGLSWSIQSGVLQIKKEGDTMTQEVYVLSPDTGLLGVPSEVVVEEDTDLGMKVMGWDVEYFLNAAINVDDFVKMECKQVNGFFRVHKVKIEGDSASGDWKCSAELLQITLDANNPSQQIYAIADAKAASKSSSTKSSSTKEDSSKDVDTDKDSGGEEKEEEKDKGDAEDGSQSQAASYATRLEDRLPIIKNLRNRYGIR